jgi:hypothetical protein
MVGGMARPPRARARSIIRSLPDPYGFIEVNVFPMSERPARPKWTTGASITIEGSGVVLASRIEVAGDSASRRKGLLGRERFDPGEAIVIAPCQGVHTFGMRFAIDIVAVARDGLVVKIRSHVPRRRIVIALNAFAIIELPSGSVEGSKLKVGDRLLVSPASVAV